jgi:hypothetical protein
VPRRLLARCQSDSVREFRASAQQRYNDGLSAVVADRRLAAIYLWGYSAEMTLKAGLLHLDRLERNHANHMGGASSTGHRSRSRVGHSLAGWGCGTQCPGLGGTSHRRARDDGRYGLHSRVRIGSATERATARATLERNAPVSQEHRLPLRSNTSSPSYGMVPD